MFVEGKRRHHAEIADIPEHCATAWVTSLTVLRVTWTQRLNTSLASSALWCELFSLRVLRALGLCGAALHWLQAIYICVILAKLLYALSGFTLVCDLQRIDGFMRQAKWSGLCPLDTTTFEELCKSMQVQNFKIKLSLTKTTSSSLSSIPTTIASQHSNLGTWAPNRQLPLLCEYLTDCNCITSISYVSSTLLQYILQW